MTEAMSLTDGESENMLQVGQKSKPEWIPKYGDALSLSYGNRVRLSDSSGIQFKSCNHTSSLSTFMAATFSSPSTEPSFFTASVGAVSVLLQVDCSYNFRKRESIPFPVAAQLMDRLKASPCMSQ